MTPKEYGDKRWNEMFDRFKSHVESTGSQACPPRVDYELNRWIDNQRMLMKSFSMRADRRAILEEYGFYTNERDLVFDQIFDQLLIYKDEHNGSLAISTRYTAQNNLGDAVQRLRYDYKRGRMSPEHESRLRSIGFDFTHTDALFRDNLRRLQECPVNSKGKIKFFDDKLRSWFRSHLGRMKNGRLDVNKSIDFNEVLNSMGATYYLENND